MFVWVRKSLLLPCIDDATYPVTPHPPCALHTAGCMRPQETLPGLLARSAPLPLPSSAVPAPCQSSCSAPSAPPRQLGPGSRGAFPGNTLLGLLVLDRVQVDKCPPAAEHCPGVSSLDPRARDGEAALVPPSRVSDRDARVLAPPPPCGQARVSQGWVSPEWGWRPSGAS